MRCDLTGMKFGKWTIIKESRKYKHGGYLWLCKCECGATNEVATQYLKDGRSTQCRRCAEDGKFAFYENEIPIPIWGQILKCARQRQIEVLISKDEAYELFVEQKGKCALSGLDISFPKSNQDYIKRNYTASLDRIDCNIDYVVGNIQWVHKDVNRIKMDLKQERFIELCELVAQYRK